MHEPVDKHIKEKMDMIFKEKERYQYELKVEMERRKTRAKPAPRAKAASSADSNNTDSPPADTQPPLARADTQVVQEAARPKSWTDGVVYAAGSLSLCIHMCTAY